MVSAKRTYLVDTTFILRQTAEAFHGAPLLVVDGKDHTFAYGFLRDLFHARRALGLTRGILVVGTEGHVAATDDDVTGVVELAKVLGLPVVHKPRRPSWTFVINCATKRHISLLRNSPETKSLFSNLAELSMIRHLTQGGDHGRLFGESGTSDDAAVSIVG